MTSEHGRHGSAGSGVGPVGMSMVRRIRLAIGIVVAKVSEYCGLSVTAVFDAGERLTDFLVFRPMGS